MGDSHPQRREADDFSWVRRNWQFLTALVAIVFMAGGAHFRIAQLEKDMHSNDTRDTAQWQRIGDVDDKVDHLRDRVAKMEGHH